MSTTTTKVDCNVYEITKEVLDACVNTKVYSYRNGDKIHKMGDSCVLESKGKYTLYIGNAQHVFDMERALNTKKPEIVPVIKKR